MRKPFAGVGISGKLASGKGTAAQAISDVFGFRRMAFADDLKRASRMVVDYFDEALSGHPTGEVVRQWFAAMRDKATPEGRRWLQWFGTELGRSVLPDIWIRILLRRASEVGGPVVVDDLRFPDEAAALRDAGFLLLRVELPDGLRIARATYLYPGYATGVADHPSETALDGWGAWDAILDGALPLERFREEAVATVRVRLREPHRPTWEEEGVVTEA